MPNNKTIKDDQQYPNEDPAVVAKVDQMMDPYTEDEKGNETDNKAADVSDSQSAKSSDELPPLDIFADTPGAPQLTQSSQKKNTKKKTRKNSVESSTSETDQGEVKDSSLSEIIEDNPVIDSPSKPDDFDDPTTAKAIDDIVAQESDLVLGVEDTKLANIETEVRSSGKNAGSHKIFWGLVLIVCVLAIAMAVYIIDPSLSLPKGHL